VAPGDYLQFLPRSNRHYADCCFRREAPGAKPCRAILAYAVATSGGHPSNVIAAMTPAKHAAPMPNPQAKACQDGRIVRFGVPLLSISSWSRLISASASLMPYLVRGVGFVPLRSGLGVRASMASPVSARLRLSASGLNRLGPPTNRTQY
jgi:hypothetical protein